jgi:leucine dehydrogenase
LNSGGIINAEAEIGRVYNLDRAREKTERIYEIMERVIAISKSEEITTAKAADRLAEDRLKAVQGIRRVHRAN